MNSEPGLLFATVLKLHPLAPGALPVTHGHFAHAAFLDVVRQVDPAAAEALHSSEARKPFTVAPLRGLERRSPQQGEIPVRPEDALWLRFTILDPTLFATFIHRFLRGSARPTIRLGRVEFGVAEVLTTPGSHPWAGYTSAAELLACGQSHEARGASSAGRLFDLELASPTAFSLGGQWGKRMDVLPSPRLVFGGLATVWDAWCGEVFAMGRGVREYVEEGVVVSRIDRLETRMYQFSRHPQVGVVGRLTYRLLEAVEPAEAALLNTLADFAFYAGLGYKTTMGMGQVRRIL